MDEKDEEIAALRASVGMLSNQNLQLIAHNQFLEGAYQQALNVNRQLHERHCEQITSIKASKAMVKYERRKAWDTINRVKHIILDDYFWRGVDAPHVREQLTEAVRD